MKDAGKSRKVSAVGAGQTSARAGAWWPARLLHETRWLFLVLLSMLAAAAIAASSQSKVVEGMTIYVGIVPAQIIRGQPADHASGAMHGGASKGEQYHMLVVLLDAKTGQRIVDAEVEANVAGFGKTGPTLTLGLMKIAESVTYGHYFDLPGSGPFRIDLKIRRANAARVVETHFEYARP